MVLREETRPLQSEMDISQPKGDDLLVIEASLVDYDAKVVNGSITVHAVCATFQHEEEDRYKVVYNDQELEYSQEKLYPQVLKLIAYAALFDGHGGDNCSDYCSNGLLVHILAETADAIQKYKEGGEFIAIDGTKAHSPLHAGYMNAFNRAQERFEANEKPPTYNDLKKGVVATRARTKTMKSFFKAKKPVIRGGTTALTLSIYSSKRTPRDRYLSMVYAVVANTEDCRLLTDEGIGTKKFKQITNDHRPSDPLEAMRIKAWVKRGEASLGKEDDKSPLRVYPGGLSVSRTIGDMSMSKAVICTPEVFRIDLSAEKHTHRFILACDGLWDILSSDQVGELAGRFEVVDGKEHTVSTEHAVDRIIDRCMQKGGYVDDITILVIDVAM